MAEDGPVLIMGETGTGKSHLAQLIHDHSCRNDQAFVVVSCSALAQRDQESELFGHFPAIAQNITPEPACKSRALATGTLLVKDVDALRLEQQDQLLRCIENPSFQPEGTTSNVPCQARVILTSKRSLQEAVTLGMFHSELYDRLRRQALHLPPLRDRREDIGPLVRSLLAYFGKELGKGILSLDPSALATLEAFPWPGNIRQLRNVVHQAVLASPGPELLKWDLPLGVREGVALHKKAVPAPPGSGSLFRKLSFR
jgi:DNA-binding NtrC family response regulator